MRSLRFLVSMSIALLVAIAPALASANLPFPGYVQTHLALPEAPPCTICHATLEGGPPPTLIHPFGQAMYSLGSLTPVSTEAQVDAALDDLTAAKTDSDCNGIIDTKQLQDGRDPNPPGEYLDGGAIPSPNDEPDAGCATALAPVFYGCGAQLSPAAPSGASSGALVAALVATFACRRSRVVRKNGLS